VGDGAKQEARVSERVGPLRAPSEPILAVKDIQGVAAPGFFKPHQTLIGLRYARTDKEAADFQRVAGSLEIADCATTLADRRNHRENPDLVARPLVAIAFGYRGLYDLTPGATRISSEAFKIGLPGRSALLGDPQNKTSKGAPANWVVGAPGAELDALVVVAGDTRATVDEKADEIRRQFAAIGVDTLLQQGDVRPDLPGHEHFGFDDGVSQPGVRGRVSDAPDDFLTPRHVAEDEFPAFALYGYPGQDLVWPGEFVIGYPGSSPDPLIPGPTEAASPVWTRNGSFLVYRRLAQDVHGFWGAMRAEADRLSKLPGFEGLDAIELASKLVGRWPSGAPVARTPDGDDPKLGKDQLANNHFRFDSDTPTLALRKGKDGFAPAKADPVGTRCPLAAHIRKVNTRDAPSDMGGRSSTYERRLLRVGVPYGPPATDIFAPPNPDDPERGLLFLSIQASIEDQFEFLQARWMNDELRPKAPSGNDLIVGQNAAARDGVRRAVVFGKGLQMADVRLPRQFVIPTGGGYFFVPSLSALRTVIAPQSRVEGAKTAMANAKALHPAAASKSSPRRTSGKKKTK
jgi:Dyp-type peroxidase family